MWSGAMGSVLAVVMFGLPSTAKCALVGVGCARPSFTPVLLAPLEEMLTQ